MTQNTTSTVVNFNTTNYPLDRETGYPKQPKDSNQLCVQMGAGWYQLSPKHESLEIATRTGVAPNVEYGTEFEPFTYGNKYLNIFRKIPTSSKTHLEPRHINAPAVHDIFYLTLLRVGFASHICTHEFSKIILRLASLQYLRIVKYASAMESQVGVTPRSLEIRILIKRGSCMLRFYLAWNASIPILRETQTKF